MTQAVPLDKMVRDYAEWLMTKDAGDEEETPLLIKLCSRADSSNAHCLAAILLLLNESVAYGPFRKDGELFDERLKAMAEKIQWKMP